MTPDQHEKEIRSSVATCKDSECRTCKDSRFLLSVLDSERAACSALGEELIFKVDLLRGEREAHVASRRRLDILDRLYGELKDAIGRYGDAIEMAIVFEDEFNKATEEIEKL